jgi:hypothetical protein
MLPLLAHTSKKKINKSASKYTLSHRFFGSTAAQKNCKYVSKIGGTFLKFQTWALEKFMETDASVRKILGSTTLESALHYVFTR